MITLKKTLKFLKNLFSGPLGPFGAAGAHKAGYFCLLGHLLHIQGSTVQKKLGWKLLEVLRKVCPKKPTVSQGPILFLDFFCFFFNVFRGCLSSLPI